METTYDVFIRGVGYRATVVGYQPEEAPTWDCPGAPSEIEYGSIWELDEETGEPLKEVTAEAPLSFYRELDEAVQEKIDEEIKKAKEEAAADAAEARLAWRDL